MRYHFSKRVRLNGDQQVASTFIKRAEALAGAMVSHASENGYTQARRLVQEGTTLFDLIYDGTVLTVDITVPRNPTSLDTEALCDLWIPHGFALYPSSSESRLGWGTPNVFTGSRFANTAPGLDVAKWTQDGKLGEVLLTQDKAAGYPPKQLNTVPLMYSAQESPHSFDVRIGTTTVVGKSDKYKAPLKGTWAAYRVEFDGFAFPSGEGGTARQSLFDVLNVGRQYCLPIRGRYDAAARDATYAVLADFGGSFWITDHDLSAAPIGYDTALRRKNKDGVPAHAIDTMTRATSSAAIVADLESEAHLGDSTFVEPATTLSLAIGNGVSALVAAQHDQWVNYGVRFWIGDDAALPPISWDGYPCINWPSWIFSGTVDAGDWVDLDWFTMSVRGEDEKIFSKRLCARGRVIGTLPDFVISAGVQTRSDDTGEMDRLLVLTWRLSDQKLADPAGGFGTDYMRRLRLYFVDVPRRNDLALALDHAVVGLYDAGTNPDGWHYAGLVDLVPTGDPDVPLIGAATIAAQPPMFKGDGTAVVYCVEEFNITTNPLYLAQTTFNAIGDALVDTDYAVDLLDQREDPAPIGVGVATFLAADYVPVSDKVRTVYMANLAIEDAGDKPCARWSHASNPSDFNFHDSDIVVYEGSFHGFEFCGIFVQDVVTGTFTTLNQADTLASYRVDYATQGKAVVQKPYAGAHSSLAVGSVFNFNNRTDYLMPVFARGVIHYIAGHELGVVTGLYGAAFDTSIGDIQALSRTPGTEFRAFPVGVV